MDLDVFQSFIVGSKIIPTYLLAINVITLIFFAIDKWKAIHNRWRIRVSTLLGLSFIGGALGGLLGMYIFRHKKKHLEFKIGLPMMLVVQAGLLIYFL